MGRAHVSPFRLMHTTKSALSLWGLAFEKALALVERPFSRFSVRGASSCWTGGTLAAVTCESAAASESAPAVWLMAGYEW